MKILLPTDGSENAESAALFLKRLNLTSGDEITLLHVISDDPFQDKDDYYYSRIRQIKQAVAPGILHAAENSLRPVPAVIRTAVMSGYPDQCIVEAAVAADADLIIMGPMRLKGIQSHIVGSVTKSVSISSPKPVLVIKPVRRDSPDRITILFTTDGSDHAKQAGETLMGIPFHDNAEITVLNVTAPAFHDIPERFMPSMDAGFTEDLKKYSVAESEKSHTILEQAREHLRGKFSRISVRAKTGDPSDEILQTAHDIGADVIVLGSKGMGGFKGVVGSVSRYILSVAECSVLVAKTQG